MAEPTHFYASGHYYNSEKAALRDGASYVVPLYEDIDGEISRLNSENKRLRSALLSAASSIEKSPSRVRGAGVQTVDAMVKATVYQVSGVVLSDIWEALDYIPDA